MKEIWNEYKNLYSLSGFRKVVLGKTYTNIPMPQKSELCKKPIRLTTDIVLDIRNKYLGSCLADLYDELTMPSDLRKAHQENDKAVMEAYGFNWKTMTESECVAELMKMYKNIIGE